MNFVQGCVIYLFGVLFGIVLTGFSYAIERSGGLLIFLERATQ